MKRLPLNINDNRASLAFQSGKEVRHTIDSSYQRWQKRLMIGWARGDLRSQIHVRIFENIFIYSMNLWDPFLHLDSSTPDIMTSLKFWLRIISNHYLLKILP